MLCSSTLENLVTGVGSYPKRYWLVNYFQIKDVYFDHSNQWIYGSMEFANVQAKQCTHVRLKK